MAGQSKMGLIQRLPWWSSSHDSTLSMQGAWVRPLVRELDSTCRNKELRSSHAATEKVLLTATKVKDLECRN